MKKIIGDILREQEVPKDLKGKLLETAKIQLLAKDLTSLFGFSAPKSTLDVIQTISESNNKQKKL